MNKNDLMRGLIAYLNKEKLIYDIDDCIVSILTGTYNIRLQFEFWDESNVNQITNNLAGFQIWLYTDDDNDSFDPDYIDEDMTIETLINKIDEFRELSKTFNLSIGLIRTKLIDVFEVAKQYSIPSIHIDGIYTELYNNYEVD